MNDWNLYHIVVVSILGSVLIVFLFYFTYGVQKLIRITDVVLSLDNGEYVLMWNSTGSDNTYIVDYILTVKGRVQPRQRQITKNTHIILMRGDTPLTPEDDPNGIRGIIFVRKPNMIDSDPRYFDLPVPRFMPLNSPK